MAIEPQRTTSIAELWCCDAGIIHIRFCASDCHGYAEAVEVVDAHNDLAQGIRTPVLADMRQITTGADRKARQHYVSESSARYKLAMAMLVAAPLQRMLGNIFLRISRPPYPTRIFNDEKKAKAWLKQMVLDGASP